ncbi:hypothetical protein BASA81_003608 [Batrachochytrium salamandrivorans]|nr:hypothetical protein BASA81_003608 [Batrachochytrium salamandrivorans]
MAVCANRYFQKTRKGKVLRVVRERYLREDIGFGTCFSAANVLTRISSEDELVEALREEHLEANLPLLLVVDTNISLSQMDALESQCPAVQNLVFCTTMLNETKKHSLAVRNRLFALIRDTKRCVLVFPNENHLETFAEKQVGETANDYNDRLVRNTAKFFATNLKDKAKVVLLSDDVRNLALYKEEHKSLLGWKMQDFAKHVTKQYPAFSDLIARRITISAPVRFDEYVDTAMLTRGLKSGKYLTGTLRTGSRQGENVEEPAIGTALVSNENKSTSQRVAIVGEQNLNRAVDGDRVAVELVTPDTAKVVGLVKKNWRACAGTLVVADDKDDVGDDYSLFIPVDHKFPHMLVVTSQMDTLKLQRVVVQMDGWDRRMQYPTGHFVKSLGLVGEKDTETNCTLFEYDIPVTEFSAAVLGCLPIQGKDWQVSHEPVQPGRLDLRDVEEVCSVDPPNCKDIDDALHCRLIANGTRMEIGVHIADVSHFVLPDTAIDLEAKHRCTSTYLVEQRLDMLPSLLTTDICSLVGHKDRFTFSVLFETNLDGSVFYGKPKFTKSIIRSRGALTYSQAYEFICFPDRFPGKTQDSVRRLNTVAKTLRAKRVDNGSVTLASQEVKFELSNDDDNGEGGGDPTGMREYERTDAHLMVEEFMLLANCAVAERIEQIFPKRALLRRHPKPSAEMLEKLVKTAGVAGVYLNVTSSKTLADTLDAAMKPNEPFFNQLLRIMTTRAMQQAQYFCTGDFDSRLDYLHYGLAVPVYTHFTSPIRRYADLVAHRMLAAAEGYIPLFTGYERVVDVHGIADNLNRRHRNAQRASRASTALHSVIYFRTQHQGRVNNVEAYVCEVSPTRVGVIVPQYGLEQEMHVGRDFTFCEDTVSITFIGNDSGGLKIFDKVLVNIVVQTVGRDKRQSLVLEFAANTTSPTTKKRPVTASNAKKKTKAG